MRVRPGLWAALDYAVAAVCAALVFGVLSRGGGAYRFQIAAFRTYSWLPLVLSICLAAPVALRRHDPSRALVMVLAASVATIAFGGEIVRAAFLPLALVLFTVAATCRRTVAAAGLAASLVVMAGQGLVLHLDGLGDDSVGAAGLIMIICWTAGYAVQQRRAYGAHLRDQAATSAVTQERLRIARELHDVVAHSMTVVAVQAGFGEYVFDSQPGEARAALGAIQTVSREALSDMQRLLSVLRHAAEGGGGASDIGPTGEPVRPGHQVGAGPGRAAVTGRTAGQAGSRGGQLANGRASAPLAPAPGLADLDRLVARTAGAGVQVAVARAGRVRDVPAGIDLSAYRIVQEALTNVVKHSGADSCDVIICYGASDLSIEITDPGTRAAAAGSRGAPLTVSSGHGLTGMRERVSLCGGEFSAEPLPGRGFRVAARLPLATGAP